MDPTHHLAVLLLAEPCHFRVARHSDSCTAGRSLRFHTLAGPGKTSESLPQESESLPREAREDLFRRRAESATVGHWNGLVSGRRLRLQVSAVTRSQAGSRESARRRYFKFSFSTGGRASVSGGPT